MFLDSGLNITLPRNVKYGDEGTSDEMFFAYGLDELIEIEERGDKLPKRILIDIANGHMRKLYNFSKQLKEKYNDDLILMVGNIANPETYRMFCDIGIEYIRCGIGSGISCTTSANVGVHYPMGSLIEECAQIAKSYTNPTKIVADGGFRNFDEINKALALGAHYVMVGGMIAKVEESCGDKYYKLSKSGEYVKVVDYNPGMGSWTNEVFTRYRGMSTKEVQKDWNKKNLRTAEGIAFYTKCEGTLSGWVDNVESYLKSAMSYCGHRKLEDFRKNTDYILITDNAYRRFHK